MIIKEVAEPAEKKAQLKKFIAWACRRLNMDQEPAIKLSDDLEQVESKRTFGTTYSSGEIWVYLGDRNTADIMRTLIHEMIHAKQFETGLAHENMDEQENQNVEDVANAMAGRLMREYGKKHVEIYS
jgi:hypothetical protein